MYQITFPVTDVLLSHFRCLRSVSEQLPCSSCLQCLRWSMSTSLQSVLASSTLCCFASSCALEVRLPFTNAVNIYRDIA